MYFNSEKFCNKGFVISNVKYILSLIAFYCTTSDIDVLTKLEIQCNISGIIEFPHTYSISMK